MTPGADNSGNSAPGKIGSAMTLFAWILFLGLLTKLFSSYLDRQNNPNREVFSQYGMEGIEVVLLQNRTGHYVATARINGMPVNIMVDTGASHVSIPERIADRMGLVRGPAIQAQTANGIITVYATVLDSVELGQLALHDIRASINPHMDSDFILLGMSFLKQVEFTQKQNQLILKQ